MPNGDEQKTRLAFEQLPWWQRTALQWANSMPWTGGFIPEPQAAIAKMTSYGAGKYPGELPKGVSVAPETEYEKVLRAMREAQGVAGKVKKEEETAFGMPVRWDTITEGGWTYNVGYDKKGNVVSREPLGRVETTQPPTRYEPFGTSPYDVPGTPEVEGQWNPYTGQWEAPAGWINPYQKAQLDLARQEATQSEAYKQAQLGLQKWQTEQQIAAEQQQQQAMLGWYQQQATMQQAEAERQEKARLAAQPISWLQYASYTGQAPVVQPWMQPLMGGYQAGQQIPGWSASGGSAMPELTRPSAQYQARMGPTALQQYAGYQQARTGATPEETAFRLGSTAPPSGRRSTLRWMR